VSCSVRKPASLTKPLPLRYKCRVQTAVRTRGSFVSHVTSNWKQQDIQTNWLLVQKAESCQPILLWAVSLISLTCWYVKLLSAFLLLAPKNQLLFLLAWGALKQHSSDESFCTAALKQGVFLHVLCSCGQSYMLPNFFILYSVHVSGSGTVIESWTEYCSCIAAGDFCLGAGTVTVLCWHETPEISTCLCLTKYTVGIFPVLIKGVSHKSELMSSL